MQGQPESLDADHDSVITLAEFASHVVRFAARRQIRLLLPEPAPLPEEPPLLQPKSSPKPAPPDDGVATAPPAAAPTPPPSPAPSSPAAASAAPATGPANRRRDLKFFIPPSKLPAGLPGWYHSQDKDGDGQVTLAEYSASVTAGTVAEFNRYDRNRDGVVTSEEIVGKPRAPKPDKSPAPASSEDTKRPGRRRSR